MIEKSENMSDIQSLTTQAQELERSLGFWNSAYVWLVAGTVILAAFVFIAQFISHRKTLRLTDIQSRLVAAKDAQLKTDLKNKDVEIGNAQDSAARAFQQAGIANQRAGEANKRAEELAKENLATESKLEKEKQTRLELEKSLAPRTLVIASYLDDRATFATLRPFPDIKVLMYVLSDAEAERAAGSIGALIQPVSWKIEAVNIMPSLNTGFYDGVVVSPPMRIRPEYPAEDKENAWRSYKAAEALVAILKSQNWEARVMPIQGAAEQDTKTLKIHVGFKPSPYFDPDWVKELHGRESK
jgi:hypothetical protein